LFPSQQSNNPTTANKERTVAGIFLKTFGTIQGGFEVFYLKSARTITRHFVKESHTTHPGCHSVS